MDRTAQVEHEVHDLIRRRWSPLAFASRTVDPEVLRSLFEAARWAPSSYNEQPWSFLAATRDQPRLFEQMVDCLIDANARWARNAPVLAISVAKLRFDRDGSPNRHAFHDVGLAVENLVIQATAWGLCVHQMGGFRPDRAREVFRIPEDHEPVAAMAIGYPGPLEDLPPDLREREQAVRTRKPIRDFVFGDVWGQTSTVVQAPE